LLAEVYKGQDSADVYISADKITVCVTIDISENFPIINGPPIVKKFTGQPLRNLLNWLATQSSAMLVEFLPPKEKENKDDIHPEHQ
jgi:hypothetical protein